MKRIILVLLLVSAVPLVARAETRRSSIDGRSLTISTEIVADTPANCQMALDKRVDAEGGWHDHIFRAVEADKAFMIYSQRDNAEAAQTKEVKVTLWKAIRHEGKTYTETRVYVLGSAEINAFLERDLPAITERFKTAPIEYTITIS